MSKSLIRYILLFYLLFKISILSANPIVDSLLHLLNNIDNDTAKIKLLNDISWNLKYEAPDSALQYALEEYRIAIELKKEQGVAMALNQIGINLWISGKLDDAIDTLTSATLLFKKHDNLKSYASTLNNLASIYVPKGNYQKALELRLEVLKIREEIQDSTGLISVLINVGNIFLYIEDFEKALDYYAQSQDLIFKVKPFRKKALADVYNNIGVIFRRKNNLDSALVYFNKYYDLAVEENWRVDIAKSSSHIGLTLLKKGSYKHAKVHFEEALAIQKELNLLQNQAFTYLYLAELYNNQKQYNKALRYGKLSLNLSTEHQYLEIEKNANKQLAISNKKLGNITSALAFLEQHILLKDSVSTIEKKSLLENMEAKYQFEKKEKEIELLKRDAIIKDNEARIHKQEKYAAIFGAMIFLVLLIMTANRLKLRRKLYDQKEAKILAEAKYREEEALRKEEELRATAEINKLNADRMQDELDHRNREITSSALYVAQKNEILGTIVNKLDDLKAFIKAENKKELNQLKRLIKENIELDDDWNNFKLHFEKVHPRFFETLTEKYPDLTSNEQKICAYLRMNLSGKEIARLLNITPKSTQMSRYRLKKKFNLGIDDDLMEFINSI